MFYQEYLPKGELARYVQLIWTIESEEASDRFPREKILPDGIVELVFHYRDPFVTYRADGTSYLQPMEFAISQMRRFIEIESSGSIGLMAVRFFPWGAYHFFETPIANFLDSYIEVATLWPETHPQITATIRSAVNHDDRLEAVEKFLFTCLSEHGRDDDRVDMAVRLCRDEGGRLRVDELCDRVQFSKKQLERRFIDAVGTTPKVFCRVSRFLHVCQHLRDYSSRTLTELALECGYYDQAHFIKEFKEFSGFTPKEFFEQNNVVFADL